MEGSDCKMGMFVKEPSTGIVHIAYPNGDDRTLCGMAFDEPGSERDEENMVRTATEMCNCVRCIYLARGFLPILKVVVPRTKDVDVEFGADNRFDPFFNGCREDHGGERI